MKKESNQKKTQPRFWLAQSVGWFAVAAGSLCRLVAYLCEGGDEWWMVTLLLVPIIGFFASGVLSLINYKRLKLESSAKQQPTEHDGIQLYGKRKRKCDKSYFAV